VGGSASVEFASEIPLLSLSLYLLDEAECDSSRSHPIRAKDGAPLAIPCPIRFEDSVRRGV
jgi:hypothetical protein